jgi:molybdate/tungstate transport system substrate-binding protein
VSLFHRTGGPNRCPFRPVVLLATSMAILIVLAAPAAHASSGTVNVLYAGSLVNLNDKIIGPTYHALTGYTYQGQGLGSVAIANEIKGHIEAPDVVELVNPSTNRLLMGPANGNYVPWYITYARTQLVIGYDPASRFASLFNQARHHKIPWYRPLLARGLHFGRTDPALDPKGYYSLFAFRLAQRLYHLEGFAHRVLGGPENTAQIFPEEVLVARLLTGQVDAGVFYLNEVKDLGIPYVTLPAKVNFGDPRYARLYGTERYKTSQGSVVTGSPILFTITVPSTVKDRTGAVAFARFVLGRRARILSAIHGLLPVTPSVHGNVGAVPAVLLRSVHQDGGA